MAYSRFKLFVQILIILSPLMVIAKGTKYQLSKEKDGDTLVCDPAKPFVLMSKRDKIRLEHLIKSHGTKKHDPNLDLP